MKSFVVLATVLACAFAKPGLVSYAGYPYGYSTYGYSTLAAHPASVTYAAGPAVSYAAAPAAVSYAAPAVTYAAPAVVAPAVTKTQYHAQDELGQASHGYAYPGQAAAEVRDAAGNVRGSYAYINPNGQEIRVNYVADGAGFRAESNALPVAPSATLVGPAPVQDTPEVAAARAAHLAAVQEAQTRSARKRRGLAYTVAAPAGLTYTTHAVAAPASFSYATHTVAAAPAYTYAAAPAYTYAAAPAISTVAAAPAVTYAAAPAAVTYAAAPAAVTYAAGPAFREATLTKVVNNPGHAVSYRVD